LGRFEKPLAKPRAGPRRQGGPAGGNNTGAAGAVGGAPALTVPGTPAALLALRVRKS
jgi:hypothetical protein